MGLLQRVPSYRYTLYKLSSDFFFEFLGGYLYMISMHQGLDRLENKQRLSEPCFHTLGLVAKLFGWDINAENV